mmetsp:Transcript_20962/g.39808  ORF Transcript_20962/g.39808 Transcript_20962/m.39808 type:complete len:314 (+) Transcript_20962:96-1037(+)|eukprot:scaffold44484_cov183-Amphora_coffeaeformis.AAC.1
MSDGPFGTAPDIGIGFSDAALLTFSFAGFGFLAYSIYTVVLLKLKNRQELGADYEDKELEKKYEEQLTEADVATLSRAQRRARARQIMKQQRRAVPGGVVVAEQQPPGEDGAQPLALLAEGEHPQMNDDDHHLLSRKERQKLAKAAEREERKLLQEERQRQQTLAMEQAQQRRIERLQTQAMQQQQAKQQQLEEEQAAARARQEAWEIFLTKNKDGDKQQKVSVEEWLQECQKHRMVFLSSTARAFGVSTQAVRNRIQTLVEERRVAGVFMKTKEESVFVHYSNQQLEALANLIKCKGLASKKDIVNWMNEQQ